VSGVETVAGDVVCPASPAGKWSSQKVYNKDEKQAILERQAVEKGRRSQLLKWVWDGDWHHAVQLDGSHIVIDWTAAQVEDDPDPARPVRGVDRDLESA